MKTICNRKALNKFQTFERSQYFSPDINEKKTQLTYKISKERRIASVVGLDNLSSNLRIIILLLITKPIFKYKSPSHLPLYILINVLIGRTEALYFLIKKVFKSIC